MRRLIADERVNDVGTQSANAIKLNFIRYGGFGVSQICGAHRGLLKTERPNGCSWRKAVQSLLRAFPASLEKLLL
jgi:hypothetical protein